MITILHTNDVHGHLRGWRGWEGELKGQDVGGADRLATAINQVRAESPHVLLLDAGDLVGDTMIAQLTKGQALLRVFDALRYDAVVIGNHEPDFGGESLAQMAREASFSVLAANVRHEDTHELLVQPHLLKDVAGLRIGILGLAYPNTEWTTAPKNISGLTFEHPVAAARQSAQVLRSQGADLIIALTHLGLGGDIHLAEEVPDIDVIVGGHSHNRMSEAHAVGKTLIVQAGAHGSDLGRLDLFVENGRIVRHRRTLYPLLAENFQPDPAIRDLLDRIHEPHRKELDQLVGEAAAWLLRAQTLAGQEPRKRDEQSPIDSLFADVLREVTGADLAFLPGVGYGVAIPPGPVTAAQLRQLVPHDGQVVTMHLSGAEIGEVLEQAVDNVFTGDPDKKVGGMIQLSGLEFHYDPRRAEGQRVTAIRLEEGEWNPDQDYRVATNSMLAAGGHRQLVFTRGRELQKHGGQYEMLKRHFQQQPTLVPPADTRIRRVDQNEENAREARTAPQALPQEK